MSKLTEELRAEAEKLQEDADKREVIDALRRLEAADAEFNEIIAEGERVDAEYERRNRRDRIFRFIFLVPVGMFFAFHVALGLMYGQIRNFLLWNAKAPFSVAAVPLTRFQDEPYTFCVLAFFYAFFAFAFGATAIGGDALANRRK